MYMYVPEQSILRNRLINDTPVTILLPSVLGFRQVVCAGGWVIGEDISVTFHYPNMSGILGGNIGFY